jgi:AraC-like DNA-binding protein
MKEFYTRIHYHDFWEIMIIDDGVIANDVNGREVIMKKSDLCIISPGYSHSLRQYLNENCSYVNLEISNDFFMKIVNSIDKTFLSKFDNGVLYMKCSNEKKREYIQLLHNSQRYSYMESNERQLVLKVLINKIITDVIIYFQDQSQIINNNQIVNIIINEFNNESNVALSFQEICQKVKFSKEYVIRSFKKAGLESPNKIFNRIKLNRAAALLDSTNLKVIDISNKIGFYSLCHFNKIFKKEFNISPREYRLKYKREYL